MAKLTLMIGLPGSGKSTYVNKNYEFRRIFFHNVAILSSDRVRKELYLDENDQSHNEEVFQYIKETAVNKLRAGIDVVIDATNIRRKDRMNLINFIDSKIGYFYEDHCVEYIVIATPFYKCLENNAQRTRQVPKEVIERMYKHFEFPTPTEIVNYHSESIKIVYPFGVNKNGYPAYKPYRLLMGLAHDNPHHRYSIGQHMHHATLIMKYMTEDKVMLKATEIHDIGKAFCKIYEKDNPEIAHYNCHANVGAYDAMFYGKVCGFKLNELIELCTLVQYHMRIHDCETPAAIDRLLAIVGMRMYCKLRMLQIADKEAH